MFMSLDDWWLKITFDLYFAWKKTLICLHISRYSTRAIVPRFVEKNKFKVSTVNLNPHQKPLLVFIEHILCWSNNGDMIIDATSGSGSIAVSHVLRAVNFRKIILHRWSYLYRLHQLGSDMIISVTLEKKYFLVIKQQCLINA